MSMDIDYNKPLTAEARQYLLDRNQDDRVAAIDAKYPPEVPPEPASHNAGWTPATGFENLSTQELIDELRRREVDLPDDADADEEVPYEEWTSAELSDELGKRRDADGKPLKTSGTIAEKAARLRADDARTSAHPL